MLSRNTRLFSKGIRFCMSQHNAQLAARFQQLFPHRYCINLTRRTDRWEAFQGEVQAVRLTIQRWPAVDGIVDPQPPISPDLAHATRGQMGCFLSHHSLILNAYVQGYPNVLIFEDDIAFHPDFLSLFFEHFSQVPADWDILYLGGLYGGQRPVTGRIHQLMHTLETHAYIVNQRFYRTILDESLLALGHSSWDFVLETLQRDARVFGFIPALVWQRSDYSDIEARVRDRSPDRRQRQEASWMRYCRKRDAQDQRT